MLRRGPIIPRRALAAAVSTLRPRVAARPAARPPAVPAGTVSLFQWTKHRPPSSPLPVYFPRDPPASRRVKWGRMLRRVALAVLAYTACWEMYKFLFLKPLLEWADSEWNALSDKEKDEIRKAVDPDVPILFLPFPFLTKVVQQPPYKGSDPEWSKFLDVSRDDQLREKIMEDLAELLRRAATLHPQYVYVIGGKDIAVKTYWLDIIFPPMPPPKHLVAGLMVYDDGIYPGYRSMDPTAVRRLNRVLYPKAVAGAAWSFFYSLLKQNLRDVANSLRLGWWSQPPPEAPGPQYVGAIPHHVAFQTGAGMAKRGSFPSRTATGQVSRRTSGGKSSIDPRILTALDAAASTFAEHWRPTAPPPTRGSFLVDGIVELKGKAGYLGLYVVAWYDPKVERFVSVSVRMKHFLPYEQSPARG